MKIFVTMAVLLLAVPAAHAADLAGPGVITLPAAAIDPSWSGCYAGASVGLAAQTTDTVLAAGLYDGGSHVASGGTLGGRLGCDVQMGAVVLGVVGTVEFASLEGSNAFFPVGPGFPEYTTTETSAIATLKARLGYLVDPAALLYVTGGAAWVHNRHTDYDTTPVMSFNGSVESTRLGYVAGLGGEFALGDGWSVFAEYNYMDLGTEDLTLTDGVIYLGPDWVNRYANTAHAVSVGVNYRF